jgi:hypothetical protein
MEQRDRVKIRIAIIVLVGIAGYLMAFSRWYGYARDFYCCPYRGHCRWTSASSTYPIYLATSFRLLCGALPRQSFRSNPIRKNFQKSRRLSQRSAYKQWTSIRSKSISRRSERFLSLRISTSSQALNRCHIRLVGLRLIMAPMPEHERAANHVYTGPVYSTRTLLRLPMGHLMLDAQTTGFCR